MKVFVTGMAGFIGFHLTSKLAQNGYQVVGIDCLNNYYSPYYKIARLNELGILLPDNILSDECNGSSYTSSKNASVKFYKGDIADAALMDRIFAQEKPDIICNLAAQAGVRYSFENPLAYVHSNVVGFVTLLEAAKKYGVKNVVYASSSSVYGNNAAVPFSEDDRTDSPESLYAATKKGNELIAHVYASQLGMNMIGLRFFTVYGPWGRPDMAPFMFIRKIMKGETIRIFNNGNLSRDFSYISDIIDGVCNVVSDLLSNTKEGEFAVYNIGRGAPVNLMDFVNTLETTTGKTGNKVMVPMQQGDVYTTYASTEKLETEYNFRPSIPLDNGIKELFNWYKEHESQIESWGL